MLEVFESMEEEQLAKLGTSQSMSRRERCWDNVSRELLGEVKRQMNSMGGMIFE